jgi:tripartite-type tricarboxylate transporter receptor subunit TctC
MKCKLTLIKFLLLLVLLITGQVYAADFPSGPINYLIPFGVGGDTDLSGRLIAQGAEKAGNITLVPTNKPGAGGALCYEALRNSKPDGYTIGWVTSSLFTTSNIGNIDFSYADLTPIARVAMVPMPIVVRADAPWKTWTDFVKDAKNNPGKFKFGHVGTGSVGHMLAEALTKAAGIKTIMAPVGVKGRIPGILSDKIDLTNGPIGEFLEYVKAGKMRILIVPSAERHPLFPDVPIPKDLGYNVVFDMMFAVFAPKNTPANVVAKLQGAIKETDQSFNPWLDYAKKKGHIIDYMDGKEFNAWLENENNFVKDLMKEAGLYLKKKKKK